MQVGGEEKRFRIITSSRLCNFKEDATSVEVIQELACANRKGSEE